MTRLAFVDTETTGLDPRQHDVWEIAVIRREDGIEVERLWQIRPNLETADPEALDINRYAERFAVPDGWDAIEVMDGPPMRLTLNEMLFDFQDFIAGCVMVGSNPAFDDAFLKKLLWASGRKIGWHYRTIDVATLAAGFLWSCEPELMGRDTKPLSSRWLSRQMGIRPPGKDGHQAMVDARWARDLYDMVCSSPSYRERLRPGLAEETL